MTNSEKNLLVLQNFILHVTHCNDDGKDVNWDTPLAGLTPEDLYQHAIDYIEEDHVDGKENPDDNEGIDLFETPEALPYNVRAIISMFSSSTNGYEDCASFVIQLESVGYTCNYGLDAEPYDLRKL